MAKCKYPDEVCANMTVLNGETYCDSVPCSLDDNYQEKESINYDIRGGRINEWTFEETAKTTKNLMEVEQYRAIGTVEECRTAVEKQKAKKPHKNFEKFSGVWCSCGKYLGKGYFVDKPNYCPDCGQKLDWS